MQVYYNIIRIINLKASFFVLFFAMMPALYSQVDFQNEELKLQVLFDTLFLNDGVRFFQPDSVKLDLCNEISKNLNDLLLEKESFNYSFNSLKWLGVRTSQDKKVRLYTWSIKLSEGLHRYFGFIQKRNKKEIQLFKLNEAFYDLDTVKYFGLTSDNWFGANYYDIIDFKRNSKKYYLLLGSRNNGYESKSKVIEVLSFSRKRAKFGKLVFKSEERKIRRVIFEYSYQASMLLQFDKRYNMLVFDHLSPETSSLKGLHRFYGPDGSYDAFEFNGSKWVYKPEVWVGNTRTRKPKGKSSKPKGKSSKPKGDNLYSPNRK